MYAIVVSIDNKYHDAKSTRYDKAQWSTFPTEWRNPNTCRGDKQSNCAYLRITAGTFLVMSIIGYTTSTDLSRFGSMLMMALVGILLAMVVNWFLGSSALDFGISVLGVLIFTGLIAYDTQKLKRIAAGVEYGSEHGRKLALLGATSLYLDFINLFLFLLRLLGRRD